MSRKISKGGLEGNMFSWQPGQDVPQNPTSSKQSQTGNSKSPIIVPEFSIQDLINDGKEFYSEERGSDASYIGAPTALNEVIEYIGTEGLIATMPYLVAGKAKAEQGSNFLWQKWFTAHSEDNILPDKTGILTSAGKSIYMCVHGGGILTPERFFKAYKDGLTGQNAAKYTDEEIMNLLRGELSNGDQIDIYHVDDVANGRISNPFGRYAVWMEFDEAKQFESGYYQDGEFQSNKIVQARTGTLEYLDEYYNKAKHPDGGSGCYHKFDKIDPSQAQGSLLFINYTNIGINGSNLYRYGGRFVVVVPKAHSSPTR